MAQGVPRKRLTRPLPRLGSAVPLTAELKNKGNERNKMKKLMIAAAIVCAAVASQAASVTWKADPLFDPAKGGDIWSDDADSPASAQMFIYAIAAGDAADYEAKIGTGDLYKEFYGKGTEIAKTSTYKAGALSADSLSSGYEIDEEVWAVVIMTAKDADGKDWFLENVTGGKIKGVSGKATDLAIGGLADNIGGNGLNRGDDLSNWQTAAIPEPTSGLLLLLGVAGLALRRRRA